MKSTLPRILPPAGEWRPLGTRDVRGLNVGDTIAYRHGVWRVARIEDVDPTDEQLAEWVSDGMSETDKPNPYEVALEAIAGETGAVPVGEHGGLRISRRGRHDFRMWAVYPRGRYSLCSCCGEPPPCRASHEDDTVEWERHVADGYEQIPPGACWSCRKPITRRQSSVHYPGLNLFYPLGPDVVFHTRRSCSWRAAQYEERWRAEDPGRPRILTWPSCDGRLFAHSDGTTFCSLPGCRGHEDANHASTTWCGAREPECQQIGCAVSPGFRRLKRTPRTGRPS